MSARLGVTSANVTVGGTVHEGVSVVVRRGVATARHGVDVVATMEGVTRVERLSNSAYVVHGEDATWHVTRLRVCVPCGRR